MSKKPNLIYIFADQLRYSCLSCHDDPYVKTPNIDKFAGNSTEVCNACSGHPVCAPYRASLFTGKYTTSTGMVINEIRMNPNHHCLAHVLNEGGYKTSYIGKWHMYANQYGNHFDTKNSFIPQGPDRLGFDEFFAAYNFHHVYHGDKSYYHLNTPEKIYYKDYEPDAQTDMAINQLESLSKQDDPFALFLSVGIPHDPWTPDNVPKKYYDMFKDIDIKLPCNYSKEDDPYADGWATLKPEEREQITEWMKVYYAMIANLDYNVGRLMEKIKALGLDENSIIVFTSDHGELFGAHGRHAKNIFYDEAVRVPFFISYKNVLPVSKNEVLLNSVDIMPTLLDLMNLPIPSKVEGESLAGALKGDKGAKEPDGILMMGTGATAIWEDGHEWRAYRTKEYTYAVYKKDGKELLFDNLKDPYQMIDLAELQAYSEIKKDLRQKMFAKMEKINDNFEFSTYYEKNWVEDRLIKRTATLKG